MDASAWSQKVDEAKYQLRARTVAVGNLSDVTAKAVLERAKKAGQMVSVRFPVDDKELEREKIRQDGCPGQVAFVTYHRGASMLPLAVFRNEEPHRRQRALCSAVLTRRVEKARFQETFGFSLGGPALCSQ